MNVDKDISGSENVSLQRLAMCIDLQEIGIIWGKTDGLLCALTYMARRKDAEN